ncbi:MAG TPA: short-chain dehydrogenase, partial [Sphingobacterium sp.]|nr:short-chain dehydrogenase [Sphingobacterium sp.]
MQIFKDKVILITGANRGIGKSLVSALLNNG